jgi:hypothetical protein
VILYRKPFSMQLEAGRNIYALWNTKASVVAGDVRPIEKRESHLCAVGAEMPGFDTSNCLVCKEALRYVAAMLEKRMGPRVKKGGRRQKELPPGYLNAIHTGEVTPQQAYEDFGIPIAEDLIGRTDGKIF